MIWKTIPDFASYEVSEFGDVRKDFSPLTPERVQGSGRKRFTLSKNGCKHRFHAAKLVAMAFIGPPPFKGAEVCHNDGFHHNNHYSNLRWDTHAANIEDRSVQSLNRKRNISPRGIERARLSIQASKLLAGAN